MASNGQWAESVIKVLRLKLDELNKQVAAIKVAMATVEEGFDMPELVLPEMFTRDAPKEGVKPDVEHATGFGPAPPSLTAFVGKLPNIDDTPKTGDTHA